MDKIIGVKCPWCTHAVKFHPCEATENLLAQDIDSPQRVSKKPNINKTPPRSNHDIIQHETNKSGGQLNGSDRTYSIIQK